MNDFRPAIRRALASTPSTKWLEVVLHGSKPWRKQVRTQALEKFVETRFRAGCRDAKEIWKAAVAAGFYSPKYGWTEAQSLHRIFNKLTRSYELSQPKVA